MPKQNVYVQSFNAGVVDKRHLVRVDLERMRLAAEEQTNLISTITGNMFLRPGTIYETVTLGNNRALLRDFVISEIDAAALEFSSQKMRVILDGQPLSRTSVSTSINNPDFNDTGTWILTSTAGADAEISSGQLRLTAAAKGSNASASQTVSVAPADIDKEHAIRINVALGPIVFRCGSSLGGDEYIKETELKQGYHSLAFTPTDTPFYVSFQTTAETPRRVTSCSIEAAGDVEIPTPWTYPDTLNMNFAQSADVMFVACAGRQQMRIERRARRSWSVVKYYADDGPFQLVRSAPVRLKPTATRGITTLTASDKFFTADMVGGLFYLFHNGQLVQQSLAGEETQTDPVRITGTVATLDRTLSYSISGTWADILVLEHSVDSETFGYKAGQREDGLTPADIDITANVTDKKKTDYLDNSIAYYRLAFEENYTSGSADISISYDGGGGYGICRVISFTDRRHVTVQVIRPFRNINYTSDWLEGQWSTKRGYPSSVGLSEGRLFWSGDDKFWGSVSDAYESFDEKLEGDSGPINRSIAIGSVNTVQWMLPLQKLVIGTNAIEVTVKSSNFDEPLSPTNLSLKSSSSVGSASIAPVKFNGTGIFADRTGKALFELQFSADINDYTSSELTRLCASRFKSGIIQMAISRRPDARIWVVLADGSCMCILYEPEQKVVAFIPLKTAGSFESVCVLPNQDQDDVYFVVKRTVAGTDYRYIEKMGMDEQAKASTGLVMDAAVIGTNVTPGNTISGLGHLRGLGVKVYADGLPINEIVNNRKVPKLFTVSNEGNIILDTPVSNYIVGLPYQGQYKSARLAYAAAEGTAMMRKKKLSEIGVIITDYVRSGIRYGRSFDEMWPLPEYTEYELAIEIGTDIVTDEGQLPLDGEWSTDSRLCFTADWPVNFLGIAFSVDTNG